MNEQIALFAFDYVEKQTGQPQTADAFDEMAHADIITGIFKELPSRNEKAMNASMGR